MTTKPDEPQNESTVEPKLLDATDPTALSPEELDQADGNGAYPPPYLYYVNTGVAG